MEDNQTIIFLGLSVITRICNWLLYSAPCNALIFRINEPGNKDFSVMLGFHQHFQSAFAICFALIIACELGT